MEDWAVTVLVVGLVVGVAIVALFVRHCHQRQHHDELVSPLDKLEAASATTAASLPYHAKHSDVTPPVELHTSHGAFDTDNPYEVLQAESRLAGPSDADVGFIPRTASKLDKRHLPHHEHHHDQHHHHAASHPTTLPLHREESRGGGHIGHRYDPEVERVQDEIVTSYNLAETAQLQAQVHHQRQSISSAVDATATATANATGTTATGPAPHAHSHSPRPTPPSIDPV